MMRGHYLTKKKTLTKIKTKKKTMTKTKTNTFRDHLQRAILGTCDSRDADYIADNLEPEYMTIFVT